MLFSGWKKEPILPICIRSFFSVFPSVDIFDSPIPLVRRLICSRARNVWWSVWNSFWCWPENKLVMKARAEMFNVWSLYFRSWYWQESNQPASSVYILSLEGLGSNPHVIQFFYAIHNQLFYLASLVEVLNDWNIQFVML